MFQSSWWYGGGTSRKPSERLETFVTNMPHSGTTVFYLFLVVNVNLLSFVDLKNIYVFFTRRLTEESMKWLETQGKHDKVIDVLTKISTVNNKPLPDLSLNTQTEQTEVKHFIYC